MDHSEFNWVDFYDNPFTHLKIESSNKITLSKELIRACFKKQVYIDRASLPVVDLKLLHELISALYRCTQDD